MLDPAKWGRVLTERHGKQGDSAAEEHRKMSRGCIKEQGIWPAWCICTYGSGSCKRKDRGEASSRKSPLGFSLLMESNIL